MCHCVGTLLLFRIECKILLIFQIKISRKTTGFFKKTQQTQYKISTITTWQHATHALKGSFINMQPPTHTHTHTHVYNHWHTYTLILHLCFISCQIPEHHSVSLPLAIHFMLTQYQSVEVPSHSTRLAIALSQSPSGEIKWWLYPSGLATRPAVQKLTVPPPFTVCVVCQFNHIFQIDIFAALLVIIVSIFTINNLIFYKPLPTNIISLSLIFLLPIAASS